MSWCADFEFRGDIGQPDRDRLHWVSPPTHPAHMCTRRTHTHARTHMFTARTRTPHMHARTHRRHTADTPQTHRRHTILTLHTHTADTLHTQSTHTPPHSRAWPAVELMPGVGTGAAARPTSRRDQTASPARSSTTTTAAVAGAGMAWMPGRGTGTRRRWRASARLVCLRTAVSRPYHCPVTAPFHCLSLTLSRLSHCPFTAFRSGFTAFRRAARDGRLQVVHAANMDCPPS